MKGIATLFLGLCVLAGSTNTVLANTTAEVDQQIESLLGDHQAYHDFLNALQHAVASNDKAAVASLVEYPITINKKKITTSSAFIKNYDNILNSNVKKAIANQKYEDLFVRDQGIMIGDGQVWASGICQDSDQACQNAPVKITAINH
ncbi:MAG: hypothetical protein QRY16_15875 [Enterobacterales bacterium endosymbiont of Blomia tropicalis]|uniref:hypothetical protein n=1 Tax=Mixta mediterraneensis TaxID=2758443 RepID=UPI001876B9A9|nr:hypothetical protein [Mixta mediterraneensis]MBE5253852.1 hypothetical protein [Mixta mediterraneensis]MDL4915199.1 hypothetical protein [Mixta mediterraneensis]